MSEVADKICGTTYFLFVFIIITYCLLEAFGSDHKYIAFQFWLHVLCGIAWMTTTALIRALGIAVGFFGVLVSIFLAYIAINIKRISFFKDEFFVLCFYLSMLYHFIAEVATCF